MDKQEIMEQQDLLLENWIKEIVENAHKDDRKPHEKVVDTTVNKSPAFYDGLKNCISSDSAKDCKQGLEHLHRREYSQAHICFLRAARSGYAECQYRLGCLYMYGRGVDTDYNLAEIWLREAAANGFIPEAEEALAVLKQKRIKESD